MTDVSRLGGGYADSPADPEPTAAALLAAARPGQPGSHLAVLAGPPGVGKSTAAARLVELVPGALWVDKDTAAAGFVLQAARQAGGDEGTAYGSADYWQSLRPLEYAGALALACANLVGTRLVLLVGGWGPELSVPELWPQLRARVAPARFTVVHLDPPPLEAWRQRFVGRGSGPPGSFERFGAAVTRFPVWPGAVRLSADGPPHGVAQNLLRVLSPA